MHFKKGQAMKKRETETTEVTEETTGAGVIAQISHSSRSVHVLVAGKVQHDL